MIFMSAEQRRLWFSMSKIVWDVNVGTCLSNRFVQPQHLARGRILWSPGPSWTSNFFHLDRPHHPVSTRLSTGNTDLDWLCSFWKVVDGGYLFHHWHQIYVQSCWVFPWSTMCVCVFIILAPEKDLVDWIIGGLSLVSFPRTILAQFDRNIRNNMLIYIWVTTMTLYNCIVIILFICHMLIFAAIFILYTSIYI